MDLGDRARRRRPPVSVNFFFAQPESKNWEFKATLVEAHPLFFNHVIIFSFSSAVFILVRNAETYNFAAGLDPRPTQSQESGFFLLVRSEGRIVESGEDRLVNYAP